MTEKIIVLAITGTLLAIPLFKISIFDRYLIRKEAKKRGWKIKKIKWLIMHHSTGYWKKDYGISYDVLYFDGNGALYNPTIVVGFTDIQIQENYPISRGGTYKPRY